MLARLVLTFGLLAAAILPAAPPAHAATIVRVGGYEFPPYVMIDGSMHATGIAVDLLALLNKAQSDYEFVFVPSASARRWSDFDARKFDFIAFEDAAWMNTRDRPDRTVASRVLMRSGDRYVAQAAPGRDQGFFADLKPKRIAGVRGFHFGFAGGNPDPEFQTKNFNMLYVNSGGTALEMILLGRADIAVVADSFLRHEMHNKPALKDRLLVSDSYDTRYDLSFPGRPGPVMDQLNTLLAKLEKDGDIDRLFQRYGVK